MVFKILVLTFFSYSIFSQSPTAKQAFLVETVSSSEVLIEATGIYNGVGKRDRHKKKDTKKNGLGRALEDAKRTAIYFLLFSGTDPLLKDQEEQNNFQTHESYFYNIKNISNYVTYENSKLIKKININGGKGLKIVKRYKINKEILRNDLEIKNVIKAKSDLISQLGNPIILVLPSVKKGESPINILLKTSTYRHAASVIESYLTSRQYDVVVPEQMEALETINTAQLELGDREDDYAYQLALSIGSDIYIEFSGIEEKAGYGTNKYAANVRAYETTTSRLLGTETGYSQARKGELMLCVEEAMNDAVDKVLSRITSYWNEDLSQGVQYKLVLNMASDFDEEQIEEIQFVLMDVIENMTNKSKENILTSQTMDYNIWCDPRKYNKSSKVYRNLKESFKNEDIEGTISKININRKMILLKVDYE